MEPEDPFAILPGQRGDPVEVGDRGVDGHQPIPVSAGGDYNYRDAAGLTAGPSSSSSSSCWGLISEGLVAENPSGFRPARLSLALF